MITRLMIIIITIIIIILLLLITIMNKITNDNIIIKHKITGILIIINWLNRELFHDIFPLLWLI